jgi:hypothetical protein
MDDESLRRQARRGLLGGVRCRLGGGAFLHRLCAAAAWAATTIVYEGKPVGTPDAGAFWRIDRQEYKVAVALFTAPTAFRAIRKEDPDANVLGKALFDHVSIAHAVSSPASAPIPIRCNGPRRSFGKRSGDRSLVADRDRLGHRRQSGGSWHAAGQAWLAHGGDAGLRRRQVLDEGGQACAANGHAWAPSP